MDVGRDDIVDVGHDQFIGQAGFIFTQMDHYLASRVGRPHRNFFVTGQVRNEVLGLRWRCQPDSGGENRTQQDQLKIGKSLHGTYS